MRDPNRIDETLGKLSEFWHHYPDLRFWQVLNYMLEFLPEDKKGRDPFFWEEHTWNEILDTANEKARMFKK